MAKRRAAEPLTFRVPWKRLLLGDFPEPPLWVPPSGRRGPESAGWTRGPWPSLRLRPASGGAAATSPRAAWSGATARSRESRSRESRRPARTGSVGTVRRRAAAATAGRGARGEPAGRRASTMKSSGSITHSSTGGILYCLLIWRILKM